MTTKAVVRDMLTYKRPPQVDHPILAANLDSWGIAREVGDFLLNNPNALLFGAIFDYQIKLEKAWEAPFSLANRLGHLDVRRIARMDPTDLSKYIRRDETRNALHRFPTVLAARLVAASKLLLRKYRGDAGNMWPSGASVVDVINRLDEFEGIGQKIARMMGRILVEYLGVRLVHWEQLDIAVDRHVARVFLRTGLVLRPSGEYSVSEVIEDVTERARSLSPSYPAALDEPCLDIGRFWCTAEAAYCDWPEEPCPVRNACPRKRDVGVG